MASMSAQTDDGKARAGSPGTKALLVSTLGGILTVAAVFGTLATAPSASGPPSLALLPQSDVEAAAQSLTPGWAQQLAPQAARCTVPLSFVTVGAQHGGIIRIRSGSYVSPRIQVSDVPTRVAVPYPSPYPTGHGVLTVEGEGQGLFVAINPTWTIDSLKGAASLDVTWTPRNPC